MDERTATPEAVPELELTELRALDLAAASAPGRPAHISAASGVVRRGDFVYVIGDDELHLGVFRISDNAPGELHRVLGGALPRDEAERKSAKPDLEALTALPPFAGATHGGILGLGSGSGESRDRAFFWRFAADGSLEGDPVTIDFQPAYDRLRDELEAINIEGAAILGDRLWLFNRGNQDPAPNAVAEFELADLSGSLAGDLVVDPGELAAIRSYRLGTLEGVVLCFSDAAALAEEMVVFTASAEGPRDGDLHGSVVGTIDSAGNVHRLRTIDRRWKVEGVHAAVDTGVVDFVFVCDQDDPDVASPLLNATMPIDAALERAERGA